MPLSRLTKILFLLACALFLAAGSSNGQRLIVSPSGAISSIKQAISLAQSGDSIIVEAGTYVESEIIVNKSLTLLGNGRPTVDGNSEGSIFRIQADSVTISGFRLQNVGFSHRNEFGAVQIVKSKHFRVHDNIMEQVFFGVLIQKSKYGTVSNNIIKGRSFKEFESGNGVHGWNSSHLNIIGNDLSELRDGIYLEFVDDSFVDSNRSYGNIRYGLHYMFSNRDSYTNNRFFNNGAGVAVMFSKDIIMNDNEFYENWGTASFGLLLKEIYDAEIQHNIFRENTVGINVEGSTRITYKNNEFQSNGWAVKFSGGCYANHFSANNFLGNAFDLSYNSRLNDNTFEGNFWSSYTGYDLDKDGVGDVPYRPVKLFSYITNTTPETIVLLRSLFIDIINFSEKVSPVFTPDNLLDSTPAIRRLSW